MELHEIDVDQGIWEKFVVEAVFSSTNSASKHSQLRAIGFSFCVGFVYLLLVTFSFTQCAAAPTSIEYTVFITRYFQFHPMRGHTNDYRVHYLWHYKRSYMREQLQSVS